MGSNRDFVGLVPYCAADATQAVMSTWNALTRCTACAYNHVQSPGFGVQGECLGSSILNEERWKYIMSRTTSDEEFVFFFVREFSSPLFSYLLWTKIETSKP